MWTIKNAVKILILLHKKTLISQSKNGEFLIFLLKVIYLSFNIRFKNKVLWKSLIYIVGILSINYKVQLGN